MRSFSERAIVHSAPALSILIAAMLAMSSSVIVSAPPQDDASDKIVTRIPREAVASSAIASVGYSKRRQILEIEFVNGAIYRYFSVPRSVYRHLMEAESKTHYYQQKIKGNFRSLRIRHWHAEDSGN